MPYEGNIRLGDAFSSRREKGYSGLTTLSVTLDNGLIDRSCLERKTDTNLAENQHLLIRKGDIAYNMMRMWQGASGLAEKDALVSPAYVVLTPREGVDSKYASYLFKEPRMIYLFWAYSYGLTKDRLRLYFNDFAKIPANIPTCPEQKKIARILSTWDKAIETVEKLIENSKAQKKALMQQLLTGNKRFPGFDEPAINGEFPKGWEIVKLKSLGKCIVGQTYSPYDVTDKSGTLVLRSSNIQNGSLYLEDNVYIKKRIKYESITVENDILICVRNGSKKLIGKSILLTGQAVGCAHGAFMTVFRAKEGLYIYQLFQSSKYIKQVRRNLGATINSINSSDLYNFKFTIPANKKERQLITSALTKADRETQILQHKCDCLKQEKKALMQQLLTGKRRVRLSDSK